MLSSVGYGLCIISKVAMLISGLFTCILEPPDLYGSSFWVFCVVMGLTGTIAVDCAPSVSPRGLIFALSRVGDVLLDSSGVGGCG